MSRNTKPRVVPVMPADVPSLVSAVAAGDEGAEQLLGPVLQLADHLDSKRGRGATCPCCRKRIRGPFATVLIYQAGNAEPSLAAAVCAECAGTAEEAVAAGEALARRVWENG